MASRISRLRERFKKVNERFKALRRKSAYDLLIGDSLAKYKRRMKAEKDALASEGRGMRIAAFVLSLVSMFMALSFIPFFPQPLPILVAVLVAFLVYISPAAGMALGCIPIVLGLLYNLSTIDFIAQLGPAMVRALFICLLVFFFVALPIRFRRYEDAIGINIGIIAATLLFFNQTYFIAIPLLLTTAILFKKTQAGLAIAYYALISVPLMVMQYFQLILTVPQYDFWNVPAAVPPIYTSLTGVFGHMQAGLTQFRMFDVSHTVGRITWEVIASPPTGLTHTVGQAITQYLDSFPGMILFLVVVGGLVWVVSLILPSFTSKSGIRDAEKLFPALAAAGVTALFFVFLSTLQHPMAFAAKIDAARMIGGIVAAAVIAVPASMLNFAPKKKAEIEKNCQLIMVKAGALMAKLQALESLLAQVKAQTPVDVKAPETKMLIIKDKLSDTLAKAQARKFKVPETREKIKELDKDIAEGIVAASDELDKLLEQYQLTLNYSYTAWVKNLQAIGYSVKNPVKIEFLKSQSPQERVAYISSVLSASKLMAKDVCARSAQVYDVVRSLCDPSLPPESGTVNYASQKLDEKAAPWTACDGLVVALNNWKKQYEGEISESRRKLREVLASVTRLVKSDVEQLGLSDRLPLLLAEAKKAADVTAKVDQMELGILRLPDLRDALQESAHIVRGVLTIFHDELATKEASIESLQPTEDGFWEKNVLLGEQIAASVEKLSDPKKYDLSQILNSLPQAVSFIDPCVWTLAQYNLKNELLLNYPMARTAIENLLKKKKLVSIQDLPFSAKDAEEYLKLFFSERNREFTFDEENLLLAKKP